MILKQWGKCNTYITIASNVYVTFAPMSNFYGANVIYTIKVTGLIILLQVLKNTLNNSKY